MTYKDCLKNTLCKFVPPCSCAGGFFWHVRSAAIHYYRVMRESVERARCQTETNWIIDLWGSDIIQLSHIHTGLCSSIYLKSFTLNWESVWKKTSSASARSPSTLLLSCHGNLMGESSQGIRIMGCNTLNITCPPVGQKETFLISFPTENLRPGNLGMEFSPLVP